MTTLFKNYKEKGKIKEALIVGRNMVNQDVKSEEKLDLFLDLLLSLSENLPSLDERKQFISQASVTLSFFEENADLTVELVNKINNYRNRVEEISKSIIAEENDKEAKVIEEVESNNNKLITELYHAKQSLREVNNQEDLDKVLANIKQIDEKIQHDYLTDHQNSHYEQINKDFTACISDKMREIEHKNNVAYNKEAVDAYSKVFNTFKNNEERYKNQTQLYILTSSTLFAYDAAKLFNETLIYYNHIYSYIFSKLDDDGKLALTRFSIECEKKLR